MTRKLVALVGMSGSGKSVAAEEFISKGWHKIRFGDVTMEELQKQGLQVNEKNERAIREKLREEHGMSAYAVLNTPKIRHALTKGDVIVDGLYSWEEYEFLKSEFPSLLVLAIYASPKTRYERLKKRTERPLNPDEASSRDKAEIENLHKAGPIALADATLNNEGTKDDLKNQIKAFMTTL